MEVMGSQPPPSAKTGNRQVSLSEVMQAKAPPNRQAPPGNALGPDDRRKSLELALGLSSPGAQSVERPEAALGKKLDSDGRTPHGNALAGEGLGGSTKETTI